MSDEIYIDDSSKKAKESNQRKARNERDMELADLREILSLPAGVRMFQRLVVKARVFHTTFTGNSNSFFNEGRRSIALESLQDVKEACPEKLAEIYGCSVNPKK